MLPVAELCAGVFSNAAQVRAVERGFWKQDKQTNVQVAAEQAHPVHPYAFHISGRANR
jgi:hypothetical protein